MSSAEHDELYSESLAYVEQLYERYLRDPRSVPESWQETFAEMNESDQFHGRISFAPSFEPKSIFHTGNGHLATTGPASSGVPSTAARTAALQERVDMLVRNYRVLGHNLAQIDPLRQSRPVPKELTPEFYGFTERELDLSISTRMIGGPNVLTIRELVQRMQNTYCRSIGVQFTHINDMSVREWIQYRLEQTENRTILTRDEQLRILQKLTSAILFESFIHNKFRGHKRFSLEGAETLIPLLDLAVEKASECGQELIILAMAHRGRLNVLSNIMGKKPREIFREFLDIDPHLHSGRGDVKYHLGYSYNRETLCGRTVHLSLCFNPSHLEFVNPVALGRARARQDRVEDFDRERTTTILVHGDASFAGEGIVQESLNLSELPGYCTGGTIHVIVNNQIGFTTSPAEGRSSLYATDVAKMLQIPIFHVNGEDPEAVTQAVRMAIDFKAEFKRDAVIDMYCYRRLGHNEFDEPSYTQPMMYKAIKSRSSVRATYLKQLLNLGEIDREEAEQIEQHTHDYFEDELQAANSPDYEHPETSMQGMWSAYSGGPEGIAEEPTTGVDREQLTLLTHRMCTLPEAFTPHPKLESMVLKARREMADGKRPFDWGTAELLSFATIAAEGYPIRFSGQDSGRGTFSQRHAILHDYEDGQPFNTLSELVPGQGLVEIINSPLSEAGVVGFEYGFSLDRPDGLVVWEAQFGDFSNAAQVIIDQFISSAEDKWGRLSGLVMLLPHGFEGQGPEHSSARLERYLMLAAEDNMQICYPSTAAQHFHLLRRQIKRTWRKPLIVMTPKKLLREQRAMASLDEISQGRFRRVLADEGYAEPQKVGRILLCTGKVYYDLDHVRKENERRDVAILRVEQLYPLPTAELSEALNGYTEKTPVYWVQEEPRNMGAWPFMKVNYGHRLLDRFPFECIARPPSASPATGSFQSHEIEQEKLISDAFSEE
jgi:2-oxoglutarate dehydrogenase E1 component